MLVLSRKQDQSVVFPTLGIRVDILRVAGKTVSVGIDAPKQIQILRSEIPCDPTVSKVPLTTGDLSGKATHEQRNRLNKASLAMNLLKKQLASGLIDDAEQSLTIALQTLDQLEKTLAPSNKAPSLSCFGRQIPDRSSNGKRALLVEDDPNERMLLASYLRASGFEVDTAEDGQAALKYLADHEPDAVVMDMEMPRLDGIACVKEIRSDLKFDKLKVFVVSGMDQRTAKISTGDRGVQGWFQKPLCPEDLVRELTSSLN